MLHYAGNDPVNLSDPSGLDFLGIGGFVSAATGAYGAVESFDRGDYVGAALDGTAAVLGGASLARLGIARIQRGVLRRLRGMVADIPNVPSAAQLDVLSALNSRIQAALDSRRAGAAFSGRYDPVAAGLSDVSYLRSLLC